MGGDRLFLLGGKGQGMWGQILAMEVLLMNAWTITGGGAAGGRGSKARARGGSCPPASPTHDFQTSSHNQFRGLQQRTGEKSVESCQVKAL